MDAPQEPPSPVVLRKPEQLRAVASAIAHQVVSAMERLRRCTVAELAEQIGVPAGSLYYHVRKLEAAGVLLPYGRRATGGRDEVIYELSGSEVVIDPTGTGPRFLAELKRLMRSRLRSVERAFLSALDRPDTVRTREGRNLSLHQHHSRLGPEQRTELYRRIEDLEQFVIENDDPALQTFTHVSLAVLPIERTPQ